jgi:glycosyltransferase involved in cell wall biosynthesis
MKSIEEIEARSSVRDETNSLRVLHLVDSLRVGGKERQIVELLKGLGPLGSVQSIVVTMGTEQFYVQEVHKLRVPLVYLLRRFRWDPTVFVRLLSILREFRPHVIHSNSEMAMSYAWPLARMMGIPVINGTIRNAFSGHGLRWQWHKMMLHLADARAGNSKAGFASRGLRPDAPGNYVIYNGLDLARFETPGTDHRADLGFDYGKRKLVGMIAEFSDYKDFPTFIRAAQVVLARRDDVIFVAVGDGKNLQACKDMVSGQEQRIRFLGQRNDIDRLVQEFDIGVLCTFTEGISNSIMEFMAAGKPVIVTDGGGSSELVTEGQQGFLVPPSNAKAVADKIELLLNDSAFARTMGMLGRTRIEEVFSLTALARNSRRMFFEVSNTKRRASATANAGKMRAESGNGKDF